VGVRGSVWRASLVFRVLAAGFSVALIIRDDGAYRHPGAGYAVAGAILAWTAVIAIAVLAGWIDRPAFVIADVVVAAGLTLLSLPIQTAAQAHGGSATLTTVWAAGSVLSAAIRFGWPGGLIAAFVQAGVSIAVRQGVGANTLANAVLLVLAGVSIGYVSALLTRAERELATAAAIQATAAERDRLARRIHDDVLQVLAFIARRGAELGPEAAQLAALAGEQEESLRALITAAAREPVAGSELADLGAQLTALRSSAVTVSAPAQPVLMTAARAGELVALTRAALDNVARHAGESAHAWVLVEDGRDEVTVSVRDDGCGIAPGRLAEAAELGRLGVRSSIEGRAAALGGRATVVSSLGAGTEIEVSVPR
jgi:signal transduction histidine kinase